MNSDIVKICERLLDPEEHATEVAVPHVAEDAVEIIKGLEADALRFRKLCAILQGAYDGAGFEDDGLAVHCSMLSGWRSERCVEAKMTWRDLRDADLDLASVLDKVNL